MISTPLMGQFYDLKSAVVLRDLYRLLSAVAAENRLIQVIEREADPLNMLSVRFAEREIIHLLVQTAVMNRLQLDNMAHLDPPGSPPGSVCCGIVDENVGAEVDSVFIDLSFREACNKIIHAQQFVIDMDGAPDEVRDRMPEGLIIRGTKGDRAWRAHLYLYDYIRAGVLNFTRTTESQPSGHHGETHPIQFP